MQLCLVLSSSPPLFSLIWDDHGQCRPLDILAGVTPDTPENQASVLGQGPEVRIGLFQHPRDHNRLINVPVLENYVTRVFLDRHLEQVRDLPFQIRQGNSGLRVASRPQTDGGAPNPHMSFGSTSATFKLYEADETQEPEEEILRMTEFVYAVADKAMKRGKAEVEAILMAQQAEQGRDEAPEGQEGQDCRDSFVLPVDPTTPFEVPLGDSSPFDSPDSVATHVTKNNPYSAHSDTSPKKVCNHCNRDSRYFDLSMRIFTQCVVVNHQTQAEEDQPVVSMRYGIPNSGSGGLTYYNYLGHYCGRHDGGFSFVPWNGSGLPAVFMGKLAHAHFQWTGSQGEVQHEIRPVEGMKHVVRQIYSPRLFHPFQRTRRMQKQRLLEEGITTPIEQLTVSRSQHAHLDMLGTLSGTNRFPVADEDDGGAEPSGGSVGTDAAPRGEGNAESAGNANAAADSAGKDADEDVARGGGGGMPRSVPSPKHVWSRPAHGLREHC